MTQGRLRTEFGSRGRYRVYAPCRDQIDKGLFVCLPLNIRGPLLHDHLRSTKDGHPICNHRRGRSTVSSAEERETLDRALTEDQNAYNKLYRTHRDRIQATVAQRTKDPRRHRQSRPGQLYSDLPESGQVERRLGLLHLADSDRAERLHHPPPGTATDASRVSHRHRGPEPGAVTNRRGSSGPSTPMGRPAGRHFETATEIQVGNYNSLRRRPWRIRSW